MFQKDIGCVFSKFFNVGLYEVSVHIMLIYHSARGF